MWIFGMRGQPNSVTLGDRARDKRDWVAAAEYYRRALRRNPDNPPIWVQYGHALKESGHRLEAEAAYRRAIEGDPDLADTHLQLGHVLKLQGRIEEAKYAYLRAVSLDAALVALPDARRELVRLGLDESEIETASAALPPLTRRRRCLNRVMRADRARELCQWSKAARLYRHALVRNPRNAPIWVQYGHVQRHLGDLFAAEMAYRHAIAHDPKSAESYLQLGHALKLQDKADEAQSAYLRAYVLDPSHTDARTALQDSRGIFRNDSAIAELEAMVQLGLGAAPALVKPTVLIVNVFYPPQALGGATRVVYDNVKYLSVAYRDEISIQVFTTAIGGDRDYEISTYVQDGVRVTAVNRPASAEIESRVFDFEMGRIFDEVLDVVRPSVVHFHCIQRLSASVVEAARKRGIHYFITAHDGWWISDFQFIVNENNETSLYDYSRRGDDNVREAHLKPLLFDAQNVLTVSDKFAHLYRQCGVPKVLAVPNGVSNFPNVTRIRSADGRVRLGFMSGTSRHKGYDLIKSALLNGRYRNLHLTVVDGSLPVGEAREEVWGITDVLFRSTLPESRVAELYGTLDVLLAPSVCIESFGLVTREALQCGCWVIASDRGSIGECVREPINGFVIDVSNAEHLMRVLRSVDADPERYLSSPPAPSASALRSVNEQSDELAKLYLSLISALAGNLSRSERTPASCFLDQAEGAASARSGASNSAVAISRSGVWEWIKGAGTAQHRAVARGRLSSRTHIIAACVPRHRGVAASTSALFEEIALFPRDPAREAPSVQPEEVGSFVEEIAGRAPDHFIVSGGDHFMTEVVSQLAKIAPKIAIHLLWHSNFLQLGEEHDASLLLTWIKLYRRGRIEGILVVKKHLDDYLRSLGVRSVYVPNVIPENPLRRLSRPKNGEPKSVGLWLSGSSIYRKRPPAVLFAAKLLQDHGFRLRAAGIGTDGVKLAQTLGLNWEFLSAEPLPHQQLMRHISETDVTAYVTVSECAPMLPLESWAVGVPAIIGPSCRYFEEDEALSLALVVKNPASPKEIANRAIYVVANKDEIMRNLDVYYETMIAAGADNLGDYLTAKRYDRQCVPIGALDGRSVV